MLLSITMTFQPFFNLSWSIKISWFFSFLLPQLIHQISKSHQVCALVPVFKKAPKKLFAVVEICNPSVFGTCTTFLPNLSRNTISPSSCLHGPCKSLTEDRVWWRTGKQITAFPTLLEGEELTDQHFFPCSCHLSCNLDKVITCTCSFYKW